MKDSIMGVMSERSEIIFKVASFPGRNNTLSPPITGASSSLTLSREILWCWIVIIINSNPLTAKLHHVLRT